MKKLLFLCAVAAASLCACGGNAKSADAAATDSVATAQTAAEEFPAGSVYLLKDDAKIQPDTKVSTLTILDFNAVWCGPCKQFAPVFEEAARQYPSVRFISLDVDSVPMTAQAFEVEAIPTVVVMRPDGTTERFVGTEDLLPAEKFAEIINRNLK